MVKKNKQSLKPLVLEQEPPSHGKQTEREDAFASIKQAFEKKQEFEGMGYMLPSKKTATPYWKDED